ncbi:crossover junction endodeoxyribonuclease RuvC [Chloroflexus sp. MS-CIW-1]|uniref:crossover junction endodeoxyribonuclease RuvC n=1 Tax=unclassified Chloroflexus TaxID=2633855 RepID=UPI0004DEF4BC|nr:MULTISPECIES: crossover junction endodeoxyribonuclease RuvC [unclassified Chloroflexus]MBO9349573.1 crossover junction endodeoxyribonuclease RuvC [Chloroflexus sp.]MDN5273518.1 crossover junction endodeoxyribonuclease RuvC [Chloroflexus sp. MS-CIW-1]
MRALGIDPGTATMGWGVVEFDSRHLRLIDVGALTTPAGMPQPERLLQLYNGLRAIIEQLHPDTAAVEELFFGKNVNTALSVGQARGVALLALAQAGVPVYEYKPLAVKQAVAGYGGADKRQMQEMVRLTLGLATVPRPDDAADALAIAICHAYSAPNRQRLGLS